MTYSKYSCIPQNPKGHDAHRSQSLRAKESTWLSPISLPNFSFINKRFLVFLLSASVSYSRLLTFPKYPIDTVCYILFLVGNILRYITIQMPQVSTNASIQPPQRHKRCIVHSWSKMPLKVRYKVNYSAYSLSINPATDKGRGYSPEGHKSWTWIEANSACILFINDSEIF